MSHNFNLPRFISSHITGRNSSLFLKDIENNDAALQKRIDGKSVLVIGGAGTIGSNYIKALLKFNPAKLYVVDTNENGLTELVRDLRSSIGYNIPDDFKTYPMNFGDKVFEKMFRYEGGFDIVANFAAHKHVRSEKDVFSVEAMIDNNVVKAKTLLDLLLEFTPQHFFCVSTDKAANPVNIMGASKKLMEQVILAYGKHFKVTTARFANVAFSNGSLLQGFIERMSKNQPLSSPSDVKRYFVSPEESGQICLLACILGETGDIFFPKLREEDMLDFATIAKSFLNDLGYSADESYSDIEAKEKAEKFDPLSKNYPVYFFQSDTTGEKSFEEFYVASEIKDETTYKGLGVVKNPELPLFDALQPFFKKLNTLLRSNDIEKNDIVELLNEYVPTFTHAETGKYLDQKM
jgi:nucleoside-diphosphate-sugar epimerase